MKQKHFFKERSNIVHKYTSRGKEVAVYEDHRSILNVLWDRKINEELNEPFDLVMFDDHDDGLEIRKETLLKIQDLLKNRDRRKLNEIIEFDLKSQDDDWVKAGMELGLIGNVFLFNSTESSIPGKEEYITQKFGKWTIYNIGNVWDALFHRGSLHDVINKEYTSLWTDFGWEFKEGQFKFSKSRRPFIFDIDLDCFSVTLLEKRIAIPLEIIEPLLTDFSSPTYHNYLSPHSFMDRLIEDSNIVTICFESQYCGGFREAFKIFNMVDRMFFDDELGS